MKTKYLVLGVVAAMTLSSCSDFLDREPSAELPSGTAIKTVTDLQYALNGVGNDLTGYMTGYERMTYGSEFTLFGDVRCNDFAVIDDNGQTSELNKYNYDSNGNFPDYGYKVFYKALADANSALANIPNVTNGDEATINNIKGQLFAWRGLLHFDLARMFCRIPSTVADPSQELGLVLADRVFPRNYKGIRTDLKSTYEFIIQEFTDALPLLKKTSDTGYFNYYAALALRARAYLYMGEYDKALADAKKVIAESGYKLYNTGNYIASWSNRGGDESLLELLITPEFNAQRYAPGYFTDATGYAECGFNVDGYLYQYLSSHPKDIRSKLIKDQTAKSYRYAAGYYPNKYPGRDNNIYVNNPKIIRLSEVYLIAAEAQWHLDNTSLVDVPETDKDGNVVKTVRRFDLAGTSAAAAQYINAIQENRIEGYENVTSVTLENILHQYEIELFCENQITFAYWRNKQIVKDMQGRSFDYDNPKDIMPIPQAECDYNKELQQNPGY